MNQTLYTINIVKVEVDIEFCGTKKPIKLSWAKGMIGVMPVFDSEDAAAAYLEMSVEDMWKQGRATQLVVGDEKENQNA